MDLLSPPIAVDDSWWLQQGDAVADIFEQAADQIITERGALKPKAYVEPPPPPPAPPHPLAGIKRSLRQVVRERLSSNVANAVTNQLYKGVVRPALARAYVLGFDAAAEAAGNCCGCNVYTDQANPYDGTPL